MESCGMSMIKYIMFIFNLIFTISGIGIILAGALVLATMSGYNDFIDGKLQGLPIVLIVAGAIVFIIAFLGCYGAIKENYNMLIAFAVALLIIFVIELAVGIAAATYRNDINTDLKDVLKKSMMNYTTDRKEAWDGIQKQLECCGVDNSNDWITARVLPNGMLPSSCCKDLTSGNSCYIQSTNMIYQDGCYLKLKMITENAAKVLIGVGIGIAFVEIVGIILACCLAHAIKSGGDK